jgi:hypothetical protein
MSKALLAIKNIAFVAARQLCFAAVVPGQRSKLRLLSYQCDNSGLNDKFFF